MDKELERGGHAFTRYADDCNVYVQSKRAGERVKQLLPRLYSGLRLQSNEDKRAVASATQRQFLGFSLWDGPGRQVKPRVSSKALVAMKARMRTGRPRNEGRGGCESSSQRPPLVAQFGEGHPYRPTDLDL